MMSDHLCGHCSHFGIGNHQQMIWMMNQLINPFRLAIWTSLCVEHRQRNLRRISFRLRNFFLQHLKSKMIFSQHKRCFNKRVVRRGIWRLWGPIKICFVVINKGMGRWEVMFKNEVTLILNVKPQSTCILMKLKSSWGS